MYQPLYHHSESAPDTASHGAKDHDQVTTLSRTSLHSRAHDKIPVDVIVWGSLDVQIVGRFFARVGPEHITGDFHGSTEALFEEIMDRLGDQYVIGSLRFDGHGGPGVTQTGYNTQQWTGKDGQTQTSFYPRLLRVDTDDFASFSKHLTKLLPYFSDGATIELRGCATGFGGEGLDLLDKIAKLGAAKQLKVVAGTMTQRPLPGIEGHAVFLQYKQDEHGITRSGGVKQASPIEVLANRWINGPLLVSNDVRRAIKNGNSERIKEYRSYLYGSLESVHEFMLMIKTKNSFSYTDYAIESDPFLMAGLRRGIRRSPKEHVKVFSPLAAEWFGKFAPLDRAALCAELRGAYDLPDLEQAQDEKWFQKMTSSTLPADQDRMESLYWEATCRAREMYPEIFCNPSQ